MRKFIIVTLLLFATLNTYAINNNKQEALSAVEIFFNLKKQKQVLEGRFEKTDPDYGQFCKIYVDFSQAGKEYLTVIGEYTPAGNIGDGIYFNEDAATFKQVELKDNFLSIKQTVTDSLSTGMKTKVVLSKNDKSLKFSITKQTSFLFIPQTIEKNCIVDNYKNTLEIPAY
jgi:hypothetical protein